MFLTNLVRLVGFTCEEATTLAFIRCVIVRGVAPLHPFLHYTTCDKASLQQIIPFVLDRL